MKQYIVPTEAQEQEALFNWCQYMQGRFPELRLLLHIPNGGSRHPAEAHNLRKQGVKAGVPDLMLPVARGGFHGLFIEMKREKGGRISDDQRAWIDKLKAQGYMAVVCKGEKAAERTLEDYLGLSE